MEEQLALRPHHVIFLESYSRQGQNNRKNRTYLAQVYGLAALEEFDKLVQKIESNKDIDVRIVDGIDDICEECWFRKSCERGQFDELITRTREVIISVYGFDPGNNGNPVVADSRYLDYMGVKIGETYRLSELFEKLQAKRYEPNSLSDVMSPEQNL